MKREEIHSKVLDGLRNCIDANGERLSEAYSFNQLTDFANTITSFFPSPLEYKLNILNTEIFENIPDKRIFIIETLRSVMGEAYKQLSFLLNNNHKDTEKEKEKIDGLMYHISFLSGLYLKFESNKDIDILYDQMIAFYNSFKIQNYDIANEVKEDTEKRELSYSIPINELESIRVNSVMNTIRLIPTIKTKKLFKHLILWK